MTNTLPANASSSVLQPATSADISRTLTQIKQRTSTGLDGVPVVSVRVASTLLCPYLSVLLSASMHTKHLPVARRVSYIAAIYKKGAWQSPANYHPIAVTPVLYRQFAKILAAWFSAVIASNHILPEYQFGFRPGHGILQPLFVMRCLQDWSACHRRPILAAFLDVSKAHDSVHHDTLFAICRQIGCSVELVQLLRCLYDGAQYVVCAPAGLTQPVIACKGVKQALGCPRSPLLFNIYTLPISFAISA